MEYTRKNYRVSPSEKHIHYGIHRAYSEYMMGHITRERYVAIVEYLMN